MDFLNENMHGEFSLSATTHTMDDGTPLYLFETATGDSAVAFLRNDAGYVMTVLIAGGDLGINSMAGKEISRLLDPSVDTDSASSSIMLCQSYCTDKLAVVTNEESDLIYTGVVPLALYKQGDY